MLHACNLFPHWHIPTCIKMYKNTDTLLIEMTIEIDEIFMINFGGHQYTYCCCREEVESYPKMVQNGIEFEMAVFLT